MKGETLSAPPLFYTICA